MTTETGTETAAVIRANVGLTVSTFALVSVAEDTRFELVRA